LIGAAAVVIAGCSSSSGSASSTVAAVSSTATVASAQEVLNAFIDASNSAHIDAYMALLADDVAYEEEGAFTGRADIAAFRRWVFAWNDAVSVEGCAVERVSESVEVIECTATVTNDVYEALGLTPCPTDFRMVVEGGLITEFTESTDCNYYSQTWEPFQAWVRQNHTDDEARMFSSANAGDNHHSMVLTDESIALWKSHLAEWIASLEAHVPTVEALVDSNAPEGVGALFLGAFDEASRSAFAAGTDGDGKPVTADRTWETASLVKMVVATAVLQLVDAGLVDLDASAADYVDIDLADTITVRDVLGHRSSIPNMTSQLSSCPSETTLDTMKVNAASATGPTDETEYSNTNFILLGYLIGQVTGTDIASYARTNIFDPLGMADTYWWETWDGPPVYWRRPLSDPGTPSPFTCPRLDVTVGNEGLTFVSTLDDLDAFLRGLFDGDLVTEDSLAQMLPSESGDDGLGIWAETDEDRGVTLYGHFGGRSGFSTVAYYDPISERSIIAFGHEPIDVEQLMWEAWDAADATSP
jgi:CubicO group peptidase (beta-lactamase class C family)